MNKKVLNLFFISILFLFLVSSVSAADAEQDNCIILSDCNYRITSDLSNEDIQSMLDNANSGDSFEFTDNAYDNISLVVDKRLNLISKNNSIVYASDSLSDKARSLGIEKTFGLYFTKNSAGSVLSGITIIASGSENGIVVNNAKNIGIVNNTVVGGTNSVTVKNSNNIVVAGNDISKAKKNGLQLLDVKNSLIDSNIISYNKKSGIETSNIDYCNITNNDVHHNDLNGISTYNRSSYNLIKGNAVYENVNGIFINSTSFYDVVTANSLTYNRKDPRSPMGGFETGNGLLFGAGFKSEGESRLIFQYNYLAHNEFFQAKNYWENPDYKLEDNWFDSTDSANTFVCPRLLASLMKLDTLSISNTIGFQMKDASGKSVNEFAAFQTKVKVNGNQYTAKFVNGRAVVDVELDPNTEYDVEVEIGGQFQDYGKYKSASGEKGQDQYSESSSSNGGESGSKSSASDNSGTSQIQGNSNYQGNSNSKGNSSGSHMANLDISGNYGTNSSNIPSQDTSDMGQDAVSNGDLNAGDSSNGEQANEGKAYEIVPPVTTSKELVNTSGLAVLSILALMGCLIYGYRRNSKDEFD